jgi:hypothetical protein
MQTASFTGLIKTVFWILIIFYAFKFIARLLMPFLMRKMMQNAEKNFQNFQNKAQQKQSEPVQNNFQSTKVKKQVGEYIEYEEIKD